MYGCRATHHVPRQVSLFFFERDRDPAQELDDWSIGQTTISREWSFSSPSVKSSVSWAARYPPPVHQSVYGQPQLSAPASSLGTPSDVTAGQNSQTAAELWASRTPPWTAETRARGARHRAQLRQCDQVRLQRKTLDSLTDLRRSRVCGPASVRLRWRSGDAAGRQHSQPFSWQTTLLRLLWFVTRSAGWYSSH